MMEDRVSRETVLHITKDIVTAYIRSAVVKHGEDQRLELSPEQICEVFKKVYSTVEETAPNVPRKVGLGV